MFFPKKIYSTLSVFSLVVIFSIGSCSSGKNISINPDYPDQEFGWINDDTYRVVGKGKPSRSKSRKNRRVSARRSAILFAQNKILEKFKIEQKKMRTKPVKFWSKRKIKSIIRKGKIVKKSIKFDKFDRCMIIYQIYSSGLMERVKNSDFSSIEIIY